MCRALRVLCAAAGAERLRELKRAAASVHWELVRGATSIDELLHLVDHASPDVVVIDPSLGPDAAALVRERLGSVRIVTVESLDSVREAILEVPPPAGPVRS